MEKDFVYSELPEQITKNEVFITNDKKLVFVEKFIKDIMVHKEGRETELYNVHIQDRACHLDNPKPVLSRTDQLKQFERKMENRKVITSKERRQKDLFNITNKHKKNNNKNNNKNIKYVNYLPLHNLWKQYIQDIIGNGNCSTTETRMVKADLHGSILKVIRSKNNTTVGVEGIVLQESENTFVLITSSNQIKVIPKGRTIFTVQLDTIPPQLVTIYGDHFCYRSYERASKRFKLKSTIEL